jgi:peptide/nickel transport system permease protein
MSVPTTGLGAEEASRQWRLGRPSSRVETLAWLWLALVLLAAIFASELAPQGNDAQNLLATLKGPSLQHPLGTDSLGRSVLVRLMFGARPTLEGAAILVVITLLIGVTSGLVAGYMGGLWDRMFSTFSDVAQSIPGLLIGLVVFAVFPDNVHAVMAVSGVFMSAPMFRVVRAAALTIRNELYVAAARAAGLSHREILWRHFAPRLAGVIRVQASMMAAYAIAIEISLGFLGLDVAPPAPSWGSVLQDASHYLSTDLWLVIPPVVVIALTIIAFGVLGEAVQSGSRDGRHDRSRWTRLLLVPRGTRAPGGDGRAAPVRQKVVSDHPLSAADPSVILRVEDLTVTPRGQALELVEHVTFAVKRGEVLGLVGETGAGKSVIARALLQVGGNVIAEGSVVFDGIELVGANTRQLAAMRGKRIAYVGQDPMSALNPLVRIESQLIEAVRTHRRLFKAEAREEALRLLAAVRLPEASVVARKYPFEISGGQAQRVAIALALAGDPDLLIADEPTTALDVTVQMAVLGLLHELKRQRGLTIILVTHDWGVVADMCDRVLTLYAGEIVEAGDVGDVFHAPRHPYTAELRKADPHLQAAGEKLSFIPGRVPPPGERPPGCRFADRCPMAIDECRAAHPPLLQLESGDEPRASRCIRVRELTEELERV